MSNINILSINLDEHGVFLVVRDAAFVEYGVSGGAAL